MAVTWNISSTKGLGTNYKTCVETVANNNGYGSLYEATRSNDSKDGILHIWKCKTKKLLGLGGKYEFLVYTHKDSVSGTEEGSGCGSNVTKL